MDAETGEFQTAWQFLTNALRLLQGMKKLGLKENDVVAMLCRNSFEANDAMLGAWLGNAVAAPMNGFMKVCEYLSKNKKISPFWKIFQT